MFGLCWKVLKKTAWRCVLQYATATDQPLASSDCHQHGAPAAALLVGGFELSPLHLMDDVLGQLVVLLLNLLLIAILMWPVLTAIAGVIKSAQPAPRHRAVLAIIPLALMVLTATGYFYTTLRLSGRWIETAVYLVIVWNLLYQTVLRGLSMCSPYRLSPRHCASSASGERRAPKAIRPQEEPTIAGAG